MKNQFSLNIKTPCSENFNQFTPTTNGGFCDSCEKEVIDFTKMNTQEIITFFKNKRNTNTCGKFNSSQLKTYQTNQNQKKKFSFLGGIGLACLSLFSFGTLQAQDTESQPSKIITTQNDKNIVVKGNVLEGNVPLPGVNIVLEGTAIGIATDFDGNFTFPEKLKKGDVLVFSYLGFVTQKVVINNSNSVSNVELKINMNSDTSCVLLGKVAVNEVYKSKRRK